MITQNKGHAEGGIGQFNNQDCTCGFAITCPQCSKKFVNNFDIFSIKAQTRCVDCQKKWVSLPENDPNLNKFYIRWHSTEDGTDTIYAKTEQEAREDWEDNYSDEREIDYITEAKKNI